MMVLSRKKNESIVVTGPDSSEITITVVELRGDKVRLGVVAPKEMEVHRQEVHEAMQGKAAASDYPSIIGQLRSELKKSKHDVERYRSMLAAMASDAWRDVTKQQLEHDAAQATGIDDIIADLDKASAA